ncbi:MAG: TMEM143 family protein [Hyphomonadaceae bacterium]
MADGYIPARRAELISAMAAEGGLPDAEALRFSEVARLLSAVLHYEAHDALEELKSLYAPLDPDAPIGRRAAGLEPLQKFEAALGAALLKANFEELDAEIETRARTKLTADLNLKASNAGIRSIRYFVRGQHQEPLRLRRFFGLWKKNLSADIADDVVVLVAFKDTNEIERQDRKAFRDMRRGVRPGGVLVKQFRNVARAELITLHPGAKPTMRSRDQVVMAVPAIAGGVPVLLQLGPALTVLFTVIAIYFGAQGVIDNSRLQQAVAALSGLVAVGAFVLRQKMKYERQTLLYQKELADTVYFRNLANNAGVLDALIGAGEEQDVKEALLAYWVLLRAGKALPKTEIDAQAEHLLRTRFALAVDFEIGDALGKLERLDLVYREGENLRARPCAEALAKLDAAWDSYFKYGAAKAAE